MAQHDYNIANDSGLGVRTDLNALFMAIATQNSGDSEPTPTYPLQWWADTLTGYLKQRNAENDAWVIRWDLTKGQLATLYSPTFGGQVDLPATTFINGNAVATLVAPNFSGNSVFETLTAWSSVSLPAATTIGGVSATELSYLDGVTSSIQSQLTALSSGKANQSTTYTITEVDSIVSAVVINPSEVFSNSQTFTASGTFTVPSGVTKLYVIGCGGGGGGGSAYSINTTNIGSGGGGGGAEATPKIINVLPSENISVVIGSGGASNSNGGNSIFKNFVFAGGKTGISASATTTASVSGAGGIPSGSGGFGANGGASGNVYAGGSGSFNGGDYSGYGGAGGGGAFGVGANGSALNSNGLSALPNTGGGGGGGASRQTAVTRQGGSGGSGMIVVYW